MANELNEKEIENLILLLLVTSKKKKLSHLHIQKEMFLLRDATDFLKPLFHFIKHYRGPFSKDIKEALANPMFLDEYWDFIGSKDKLTGGYIKLTNKGINEGNHLVEKIKARQNQRLNQILAAMSLLHDLYDNLLPNELLYIIYKTPKYFEYTQKSIVYNEIMESNAKSSLKNKLVPLLNDNLNHEGNNK